MKNRARLVLSLAALACLGGPLEAGAYCTTRERIQLRNEGVPPVEIDRLCAAAPQQGVAPAAPFPQQMPRPRFASVCVTNAGPCPMAVAMPVGASCACYTPWGAVPGVAQ
ncbi:hypothetical protein [Zoogloea sp.]|uniref:hypothetical protein n=1 Tax=Zoogloea sp. TaxID=49181 RepID=UPI001416A4C5|nr:MAG: hypothetical protein F9K15_16135 [Zoogloea sp.]